MNNPEGNHKQSNEVRKIQGKLYLTDIMEQLNLTYAENLFLDEQQVTKVTIENPVIVLERMGECSCDIFKSKNTGEIFVSHTMPPYEDISIKKLSHLLSGPQEVTVIGTFNTDSNIYKKTSEVFSKLAPSIKIDKVKKENLDAENFEYTIILDFKNHSALYFYYDEVHDTTFQKKIDISF